MDPSVELLVGSVDMTLEWVKDNKLTRQQDKKYVNSNKKIFDAWKDYEDGVVNPYELLKKLS